MGRGRHLRQLWVALVATMMAVPAVGLRSLLAPVTPLASAAAPLVVSGTTTPAISHSRRMALALDSQPLSLEVAIPLRNRAGLESRIQGLTDPQSPFYQQFMTPAEVTAAYGPTEAQLDAVKTYLRASGITIRAVSPQRNFIDATTTVRTAQTAFGVRIWEWQDNFTGRKFFSNDADPILPADIAPLVASITGLDDFAVRPTPPPRARSQSLVAKPAGQAHPIGRSPLTITCTSTGGPPSGTCAEPQGANNGGSYTHFGYSPDQLQHAYFINTLSDSGLCGTQKCDGAGQGLGILEDGQTWDSGSESQFITAYGLGSPAASAICTANASTCPLPYVANGSMTESDLDVQVAHAVAPGAQVVVYETPPSNPYNFQQDTQNLLSLVLNQGTTHVNSYSNGECESDFGQSTIVTTQHGELNMLQMSGKVLFVSSGDTGKNCLSLSGATPTYKLGVSTPASDPDVTAVGGTNLFLNSDNSYAFEYAWSEGGGGASAYFARPAWQAGPGVPAGSARLVPDVSADAYNSSCDGHDYDITCPGQAYPGAALGYSVVTYNSSGQNIWTAVGGTSAASPLWASVGVLYNQYAALKKQPLLDANVNKRLYILASHNHYYGPLIDVKYNPPFTSDLAGAAGTGWDFATGVGTPIAYNLILDIAFLSVGPTSGPAATAVTITGAQFYPGESVTAKDSTAKTTLCSGAAGSDGSFSCTATIPASAPVGSNTLTAVGSTSREQAVAKFKVTGTGIPIVNGSFEADTFAYDGTWDLGGSNPLTGWTTFTNGNYPGGIPYPNAFNAGPTPYGNQWVTVGNVGQGGTWIEQTVNGLTPGHIYSLNFAAATEQFGGGQALLGISFPSGSSTSGKTIAAPAASANYWDTWGSFSVSFTASSSSVTFRFTGLASSALDPAIDNVSLTG